ncbi:hypothetical protein SAMN05421693_12813 [Ectothiorhodospira magna]|uniref:Uncharacterized protein n=1 Tax=Ectothiorhodospira magna TaxID=867345 RepID=A0A1H9FNL5_9GAMM|nr:hypothetical protein [Ectothiorhodospira magna]SEQ39570.1 hypothetical protein SAMN05421693_12813 [Ectothiorhodospira magna]
MNLHRHDQTDNHQMANNPFIRESVPKESSPWHIVPMADYVIPSDDRVSLIKKRWKSLHRLFGRVDKEASVARAEEELRALPNVRLANLVPPINWSLVAEAFAEAHNQITADASGRGKIDLRSSSGEDEPVRFLIGQPCCNHAATVQRWAAREQARVLTPPETAQILAGGESWLESLPTRGGDQAWVLPALERCFLRHTNGLDLVRRFLERAISGELGPGVIGCDSWAFAFVQRIWPLPGTAALTLQAFDGAALADLFVKPKANSGARHETRFLSASSGESLLPEETQTTSRGESSESKLVQTSSELRQLATHCRGNPGLAWHYWRKQLRSEPQHDQQNREEEQDGARSAGQRAGQPPDDIVWVVRDVEPPALPADTDEDVAFVLHALLLHRGLTTDLLALLLPIPRARVASQLLRLQVLGLLVREDERWQVAPLAYPVVREFLRDRSYLIDAF